MPDTFPPKRESALVTFTGNFKTRIALSPTTYGLVAAQSTFYGTLSDDFVAKWNIVQVPATRNRPAIAEKNASKAFLLGNLKVLAGIIQKHPGVTDAMRIELGLPVRDATPSPINPPTERPIMEITRVDGRIVSIRLRAIGSETRSKPAGVWGASICSFVGATPPADIAAWKTEGESTRTDFDVEFPATIPAGSQVWLTAYWKNPRLMSGPACIPQSVYVGGGLAEAA